MAEKTIPQLQETTTVNGSTLIPVDSGIQSFKISAPNLAAGLREFMEAGLPRWSSTRTYSVNDVVNYNGVLYTAKVGSTNVNPTDTDYWIANRLYAQINLATDPNKGDFTSGLLHVSREGRVVTVSGMINSVAVATTFDSADNLIPFWALPEASDIGDYAHSEMVHIGTPEDPAEPIVRSTAVIGTFASKVRALRIFGTRIGVWPNTAYNPFYDGGVSFISMSYIGVGL